MYNKHINPFSAGTVFIRYKSDVCRRQILSSKDGPRAERTNIFLMVLDPMHIVGIQINRRELTKTFMMIKIEDTPLFSMV